MLRRNNPQRKSPSLPISPLESANQPVRRGNRRGQNVTEYLIIVAGVLTVVILAANSRGIFTRGTNKAIEILMNSAESVAQEQCLGPADDIDGGWSAWGSLTPCTSCVQTRTRTCDNPAPQCNGQACRLTDGTRGLIETDSVPCVSGSWVVGSCGACNGSCGSTTGTCPQAITCTGGCCDPATRPPATIPCVKAPYTDTWSALNDWSCSTPCGPGVENQTVTCSGTCCDPALQPDSRRACTNGCCPEVLDIGSGLTDSFGGPAANGQPWPVTCPTGYGGNPTRTCTATASSGCSGNATYSPPGSCYNIFWGPLSNGCVPGSCSAWTTDIGSGLVGTFPASPHGTTLTLDCASIDSQYQGTSSAECSLSSWINLAAGCAPRDCSALTSNIGGGLTGTFPASAHGDIASLDCTSVNSSYTGTASAECSYGSWINQVLGCTLITNCPAATFPDPNGLVTGTFPASPQGTPVTLDCSSIDNRYTGSFGRTCDAGNWINPTGGCTPRSCPAVTVNVNGINVTFPISPHGTSPTVDCNTFNAGYTGTVSADCNYGNWSNLTGTCTPLTCGPTPTYTNATVGSGGSNYGDTRPVTCNACYSGSPTTITCGSGGWSGSGPTCTPVSCPSPTSYDTVSTDVPLGPGTCNQQRTVSCATGYTGTPTTITCSTTGSWTGSGPTCTPLTCTGTVPSNSTLCTGDSSGLTADTPRTLVAACTTGTKCEYFCTSPYVFSGGTCVAVPTWQQIDSQMCVSWSADPYSSYPICTVFSGTCATVGARCARETNSFICLYSSNWYLYECRF